MLMNNYIFMEFHMDSCGLIGDDVQNISLIISQGPNRYEKEFGETI